MLAKTFSAQIAGLTPHTVTVETDMARGLHSFSMVGLPDRAVEEAKDRINAAIKNSGFKSPQKGNKKVVVSLAPADLKKEGPLFDVAIALSVLSAQKDISFNPEKKLFLGELSLDGSLRPIKGALPLVHHAKQNGFTEVYLPKENAKEAALISGVSIFPAETLLDIVLHISKPKEDRPQKVLAEQEETLLPKRGRVISVDFKDIRGQEEVKRGLEIAAAGGHNVALTGPPGTGKTLLAKAFPGILPELTKDDVIEVTGIHSVAGRLYNKNLIVYPPFSAPHHTSSYVSLVGGGTFPKPGEITLSHKGVLFLDEFPEFEKRVIESLRQPLEDKVITIARANKSAVFPAHFMLIAAMNLCPCGNTGSKHKECICTAHMLERYQRKISGPIIDRIDVWLTVPEIPIEKLRGTQPCEESSVVRGRVVAARTFQETFFKEKGIPLSLSSHIGPKEIQKIIQLDDKTQQILDTSAHSLGLSARAYHKVLKLAFTIASLDKKKRVEEKHILEALQYRPKKLW